MYFVSDNFSVGERNYAVKKKTHENKRPYFECVTTHGN